MKLDGKTIIIINNNSNRRNQIRFILNQSFRGFDLRYDLLLFITELKPVKKIYENVVDIRKTYKPIFK